jgi:phosphoglycerate dehydrogenase-like enzyme
MIYLILAMLRDQTGMDQAVRGRLLGQPLGRALIGSNVLIVGFGALGAPPRPTALRPSSSTVRSLFHSPVHTPADYTRGR